MCNAIINLLSIFRKYVKHKDMNNLMQNYSFYLALSDHDSQNITMCEAMASGLIIIARPINGVVEFVNRDNALIIHSPEDLLEVIESLNKNSLKKEKLELLLNLRKKSIETIRNKCNINDITKLDLEIIRKTIQKYKIQQLIF